MDKFSESVKGFANCHSFAQTHCQDTMVVFSLRVLSKVLLDKDHIETSKATERAKLAYEVHFYHYFISFCIRFYVNCYNYL